MEYKLYHNERNTELILFFNGWAMTPESIEHLVIPNNYDLIVLWDYRETNNFPLDIISGYKTIRIVAWSLGVWAADITVSIYRDSIEDKIKDAVAVCGTGYPMDDRYGIPVNIFENTLNSISEENRERFNRRMCGGKSLKHLFEALKRRPTNEIKEELAKAYHSTINKEINPNNQEYFWSKAIIGGKDRIIPPENQLNYWKEMVVPITVIPSAQHYLFQELNEWIDIWQ